MKNQPGIAGARRRWGSWVGLVLLATASVGVFFEAHAGATERKLANAKVKFIASASTGFKIIGTGTDLKLENQGPWLVFKVPLNAVSTKVGTRDRQMRDRYLEADTHPSVELRILRAGLKVPKSNGVSEGDAKGTLTLHGKARETTVHYSLERQGDSLQVSGSFRIDLREHGIDIPTYRGITVRPEVDVEVAFGGINRAVVADAM